MSQSQTLNHMSITPIKAFTDNYIWALTWSQNNQLALVDPGDANVCLEFIQQHQLVLSAILITHHHADHTGGVKALVEYCQQKQWPLAVFTPNNPNIPCSTQYVQEGDEIHLANNALSLNIVELPGHTLDHIGYFNNDVLFCGDTLFSGGCGRLFEGSAEQMHSSLAKLAQLPERTAVYCTHEYTLANLKFALAVEPSNQDLQQYYHQIIELYHNQGVSLPSSIAREKQINPFLRTACASIKQSAQAYGNASLNDEVAVFAAIRQWKDNF